ncbi:M14 family metallopeptidase [Micromonospora peucetia]|uniref:Chitobiase/beta-hexosaminidase C-terminal domain-containing protein n=1 Tax=Micromonospora peucetia TaxID=47871 RepID=A0A1C6W1Z0_9ACTN|nr:M14 family metallopeptidase [Micromonospora peucetia]WSA31833.1 M14 family metallopeptidase [Micromonospora peucetia]SCL72180.1 Chitobiase/beta-hexosaminidase C-terminal domain-containing protein [Micromonospora peucetia]
MRDSSGPRWRRRLPVPAALAAATVVVLLVSPASAVIPAAEPSVELVRVADEEANVVEVLLAGTAQLDALVATGVDLDHHVTRTEDGVVAHAVVTATEATALTRAGFTLGKVLHRPADARARVAEREATIAGHVAQNREFAAATFGPAASAASDVKIIRADWYTSGTDQILSVEAKWAQGQTAADTLTVERDSGPGTAIGSGGTQTISRFVDAGVYLYHRGAANVTSRPDRIRITSPTGDVAVAKVREWLPTPGSGPEGPGYQKDFVTSYLTPTELYARIHQLAAQFPRLAQVVELPHKTNGYRRHAQAVLGAATDSRVAVDSLAWGHEGGNDISVELADPGTANAPLSVAVTGRAVRVTLGTDAAGTVTSTAAQVVAALNADAGTLLRAYAYRGSPGTGVVAPAARTPLTDGLSAPASVSRDPHPVYAIRIGKHRDGSKLGVLAYAQEHAREWVPPLVTVETAERLLRNYAHDRRTRELLDNLDIWIAPSVNPDGGHYSFYDFNSQRKNMTNHCPTTGAADFLARNSWGVDNNRNYTEYSLFDGYSGASSSCTSGTYAGPSELSEPENRNLDWLASRPNIKFSMNLHSSGNYFMWSPGAYALPGRVSAPRPTLAEESAFWGASSRILAAIKRHRNMAVTPARTGPISDVLYSAAGNSGDMLWYKYGIYAWNFEVGTSFQPEWDEAHEEAMEFANGLVEMLRVARDFAKDKTRPRSTLTVAPSATPGMVDVTFSTSEPAAVFYTVDRAAPTYASTLYGSAGIREGGETLTVPAGTRVHWFSVDSAGNVENNYRPDGNGRNYRKGTAVLPRH